MTRKTDDHIILQMLREGKTQKEIAEHFNVSGAAICKRVKKVLSKKPESFKQLTERNKNLPWQFQKGKLRPRRH